MAAAHWATTEFASLMGLPVPPLDRAMLLIAAHAIPELSLERELDRLDQLSQRCATPNRSGLFDLLFAAEGFSGALGGDYYSPESSLLPRVLDRRRGMPISIAVVAIEVGRRVGVELAGVGMPGHFLLTDPSDPTEYFDPFDRGRNLTRLDCQELFESRQPGASFHPSFLAPATAIEIIARVLNNLKGSYARDRNREELAWVLDLRCLTPLASPDEHRDLARVLSALGRFDEAANALERRAGFADDAAAEQLRSEAVRLRSVLN